MVAFVCAGVRSGRGDGASGLQGLDDGLVPGLLAPPAAVLRCPRVARVLAGPGYGVGRRGLRLLCVPLPYIRDILGHVDLSTTEIYARASTEAKRKALEAAYQGTVTSDPLCARMEPRPRSPRLARQPLTRP